MGHWKNWSIRRIYLQISIVKFYFVSFYIFKKQFSRHEWDNYEDSTTFEYSGELGLEYRERTQALVGDLVGDLILIIFLLFFFQICYKNISQPLQDCGANKPECARGQSYPVRPRVRGNFAQTFSKVSNYGIFYPDIFDQRES